MVLDDDFIDPDQAGISGGEEEDFLDDDDSGDDYRQPSLASRPRLGTSNFPTRDKGKGQEGAAPSAKPGGKPSERAKSKSKSKDGYSWEATYKRSWDAVHEDESGSLAGAVRDLLDANKRKRCEKPGDGLPTSPVLSLALLTRATGCRAQNPSRYSSNTARDHPTSRSCSRPVRSYARKGP